MNEEHCLNLLSFFIRTHASLFPGWCHGHFEKSNKVGWLQIMNRFQSVFVVSFNGWLVHIHFSESSNGSIVAMATCRLMFLVHLFIMVVKLCCGALFHMCASAICGRLLGPDIRGKNQRRKLLVVVFFFLLHFKRKVKMLRINK